jgi:2-polyprenyl-3-methyl-5-hydroxy-6-metoxy-1,4-benzoquinol methylase
MAQYHVAIIRPEGYVHSDCFFEVAEALRSGLCTLGHSVDQGENTINALATNIVLGAHLLTEEESTLLLPSTIIFNLEQIGGAKPLPDWYAGLAARHRIWDYSPLNLRHWNLLPCVTPSLLVEIGFVPELRHIVSAPVQDIDVLFYGSLNDRRSAVINALRDAGLQVVAVFAVYGSQRDALIARAKVVLNVHYHGTELIEIVRISYLLANAKAVVSEPAPDLGTLGEAIITCPYEELVETCVALVRDEAARVALERKGAEWFERRDQATILRKVLAVAPAAERRHGQPAAGIFPGRLNPDSAPEQQGSPSVCVVSLGAGDASRARYAYYDGLNEKLYAAVPPARRIIEFGCAGGRLGERYKQAHPAAFWVGVDIEAQALSFASGRLDATYCINIDEELSNEQFTSTVGGEFDCVVFGDLLEHLKYPARFLEKLKSITTHDATIVCCVPNMAHISVIERMLMGDISYDSNGLLDETHLRFFSPRSLFKLLLDSGWLPHLQDAYLVNVPNNRLVEGVLGAAKSIGLPRSTAARQLLTYQMIVRCCKSPVETVETQTPPLPVFSVIVAATDDAQLDLNVLRSPGLKEAHAEVILVRNAASAAEAFTVGARSACSPWLLFCHQDVYFPRGSGSAIASLLSRVPVAETRGSIIGFAGLALDGEQGGRAGLVVDRTALFDHPATGRAISIDEFCVALRRDTEHSIDPTLGWHLWATDLCLQALYRSGGANFASIARIPLLHNSTNDGVLSASYHRSETRMLAKYPHLSGIASLKSTMMRPESATPCDTFIGDPQSKGNDEGDS